MRTTETIDRLFLELSQFTQATTERELVLHDKVTNLKKAMKPFAELVEATNGRIPYENLSAADWHDLVKAFRA